MLAEPPKPPVPLSVNETEKDPEAVAVLPKLPSVQIVRYSLRSNRKEAPRIFCVAIKVNVEFDSMVD